MQRAAAAQHRTFCRICPALCGLIVEAEGERVLRVMGDPEHPLSKGYSCAKGRGLAAFHHHPRRLDAPRVRERSGTTRALPWPAFLDELAGRLRAIVDVSGPDAVAVYCGTWAWMDSLGRRGVERLLRALGSQSRYSALTVDAAARSLVAELMAGSAAVMPTLDPEGVRLLLLIGTNPVVSHGHSSGLANPVGLLRDIRRRGELWVVDPRRTRSARLATRHLAPRPGTDHALLAFLVRELLVDGADASYLAERACGVDELRRAVAPYTRERAAAATQLDAGALESLLGSIRRFGRLSALSGTGVTMAPAGNLTEWLLWALQIITGSFDRPGGLWFNPGYLLRLDRRSSSPLRPVPAPASRPDLPGRLGERPCAALVDEIEAGRVRALLVIGGNPVTSLPERGRLAAALRSLDVLAVADVVESDTVALATHVLPAAGQLERGDVTYYMDQFAPRIAAQYTPALLPPAAERRPVWWIAAQLAARLGCDAPEAARPPDAASETALLEALLRRSPSCPPDLDLERAGVLLAEPARLYDWLSHTLLRDGRWQLAPAELVEQLRRHAASDAALLLVPRRVGRRMNSAFADVTAPEVDRALLIHPRDAARLGLRDADQARIASATGTVVARVAIEPGIRPGAVSLPHGLAEPSVSALTSGRPGCADPRSGMTYQGALPVAIELAAATPE